VVFGFVRCLSQVPELCVPFRSNKRQLDVWYGQTHTSPFAPFTWYPWQHFTDQPVRFIKDAGTITGQLKSMVKKYFTLMLHHCCGPYKDNFYSYFPTKSVSGKGLVHLVISFLLQSKRKWGFWGKHSRIVLEDFNGVQQVEGPNCSLKGWHDPSRGIRYNRPFSKNKNVFFHIKSFPFFKMSLNK